MSSFGNRIKHAWTAFAEKDTPSSFYSGVYGESYGYRQDKTRMSFTSERSMLAGIYTRIGIDVAAIDIRHVRLDENQAFSEYILSGLDNCLTTEANIDQPGRAFRQDIAMSLFDKGVAAIVPVETGFSPINTGSIDIKSLRVGEIVGWYPKHVRVKVYNENSGKREELVLPKSIVAIVENPLYSVMNEPNSTLKRLAHKLALLDNIDDISGSGKLDLIIQLPYVIKSEARAHQAEQRKAAIEDQLKGSKYGIAYTDATEKITQLNRSVDNNLVDQVQYLNDKLYAELGLTKEVLEGTADEAAMINYYNRTVEPILGAISEALKRTFLSKTARSQGQSIEYYRDPFKLVPVSQIAEIADKLTRNAILSSNEMRSILSYKPSESQGANELVNKNMPQSETPQGQLGA